MDRRPLILRHITKHQRGIEVAPWFAPLTSKHDGYNCLVLDVFDKQTLLTRAENDPNIPAKSYSLLEDVDFVGSATEIAELVPSKDHGTFDYIVSSHNFEHLPNPIRFLQGCQKVLKSGGVLSMAVPDYRVCFDFFRPHTTLADWLEAFTDRRTKPTSRQVFALAANMAALRRDGRDITAFSKNDDPGAVACIGDLKASYAAWQAQADSVEYTDTHCSVMSPASFELLISECRHLGLLTFDMESVSGSNGCEFYVHLVNAPPDPLPAASSAEFNVVRTRLMQQIWDERARASAGGQKYVRWLKQLNTVAKTAEKRTRKTLMSWGRSKR